MSDPKNDDTSVTFLGNTVGAFASRMKRELAEQEARDSQAQKAREERHSRMLQAMTISRKALQATAKINMGSRFGLEIEFSELDGWPKVELILRDSLAPEMVKYSLQVIAHDRSDLGTVQMSLLTGEVLGRVLLKNPDELQKIPLLLKKSVRHFLDLAGAYVLNPMSPEQLDMVKPVEASLDEPQIDEIGHKLKGQDLFVDDDVDRALKADRNVVTDSEQGAPLAPISFNK